MSTGRGRDTSFNPTGEGAAATRQVSPNDLSSKKLLCASFCSHALKPGRRILFSAARYFFVARMTIASLFVGHESAPPFALLLLRTAILRVFRNSYLLNGPFADFVYIACNAAQSFRDVYFN